MSDEEPMSCTRWHWKLAEIERTPEQSLA